MAFDPATDLSDLGGVRLSAPTAPQKPDPSLDLSDLGGTKVAAADLSDLGGIKVYDPAGPQPDLPEPAEPRREGEATLSRGLGPVRRGLLSIGQKLESITPKNRAFPRLTPGDIASGNVRTLLPGVDPETGRSFQSTSTSEEDAAAPFAAKVAAGAQHAVAGLAEAIPPFAIGAGAASGIPLAGRLISLGFGADMLLSLPAQAKTLVTAVDQGDVTTATEALVGAGLGAYFGVKALKHGAGPGIVKESPLVRSLLTKRITEDFSAEDLREIKSRVNQDVTEAQAAKDAGRPPEAPTATPQEHALIDFIDKELQSNQPYRRGMTRTTEEPIIASEFWRNYLGFEPSTEKTSVDVGRINKALEENYAANPIVESGRVRGQPSGTVPVGKTVEQAKPGDRIPSPAGKPPEVTPSAQVETAAVAPVAPTLFRGTTLSQWEAIQRGETPQSEFSSHGLTWATLDRQSAEAYSRREGKEKSVLIEYKPTTMDKVGTITDDPGDKRRQGKLGLEDIAKVYDGSGKVIYDASTATIPEKPETIAAQIAMINEGKRNVVQITEGEVVPEIPAVFGLKKLPVPGNGTFIYNPKVITPSRIKMAVEKGTIGELLGYGIPAKPAPGTEIGAVVVRAPDGTEKHGVLTDEPNLPKVLDAATKVASPGDTIGIEPEAEVIAKRQATKPEKTTKTETKWKEIGVNASGNPVFEDERGVRSYTEKGIRVSEPVGLIPTKEGGTAISIGDRTGTDFETVSKPTPERIRRIQIQDEGIQVVFPDKVHTDLFALHSRFGKLQGKGPDAAKALTQDLKRVADAFGFANQAETMKASQAYRNQVVDLAKQSIEQGKTSFEAPKHAKTEPATTGTEVKPGTEGAVAGAQGEVSGEGAAPKETPPAFARPQEAIATWVAGKIATNEPFKSDELFRIADAAYGKSQAEGGYTAKDAYDAMEMGVNLYIWRHPQSYDPRIQVPNAINAINGLKGLVSRLPTHTKRDVEQDQLQQFSTPPPLGFTVAWVANIGPGDVVLEPSAGIGGLAVFAKNTGAKVVVNELSDRRAKILEQMGFEPIYHENAEQLDNILPDSVRPTVVIMNPPFSVSATMKGKKSTEFATAHLEQALGRLQPGGRLVAIVGEGMAADRATFKAWWKMISSKYNVRANVHISGDEYKKYGTSFGNQIVIIDKPKAGELPPANQLNQSWQTASVKKIEDLIPLLEGIRNEREPTARSAEPAPIEPAGGEVTGGGEAAPGPEPAPPVPTSGVEAKPAKPAGGEPGTPRAVAGEPPSKAPATTVRVSAGTGPRVTGGTGPVSERLLEGKGSVPSGGQPAPSAEPARAGEGAVLGQDLSVEAAEEAKAKDMEVGAVFENYKPQINIKGAKDHPTALSQSAAMSSVPYPETKYKPSLPSTILTTGALSGPQFEAVMLAGAAHGRELPDGRRRGFFIGDGTGVGKGRTNSAIIWDNWNQGRKRHVWLTADGKLFFDAQRDMDGIGWTKDVLIRHGKIKLQTGPAGQKVDNPIPSVDGVLFSTYSLIRSEARMKQLVEWLGKDFDGVIIMDESHKMANAVETKGARGKKKASEQALMGIQLQAAFPKARKVYVSATGATEVSNLAYAEALGLWGEGTPFPNRDAFISEIGSKGMGAMEIVAKDLKAMGMYVSRNLSFDGVTYERLEHKLTDKQREMYDALAGAWQIVLRNMNAALGLTGADKNGQAKSAARSAFWGAHQRFFNQLLTSLQMPTLLSRTKSSIDAGHSVVVQLVNTNEAQMERALSKAGEEEETPDLETLDITPRESLIQYIDNAFPVDQYEEYTDDNGTTRSRPVVDSEGNRVQSKEAVAMREDLKDKLASIRVPMGALDELIETFGEKNVAEVTGRSRRVVTKDTPEGRKKVVENRNQQSNIADRTAFNDRKKRILGFSDAGGTGASYHADRNFKNQDTRDHIVAQPGWRADNAIQGLGRSHRSNQKQPPNFILISTDVPGHKRFVSTIARRIEQLGALTKGQRQTTSQGVFDARDNLESTYARESLRSFLRGMANNQFDEIKPADFSAQTGLELYNKDGQFIGENIQIGQFLNRLLSLNLDMQDKVFKRFSAQLDAVIEWHKTNGTLDAGMETLTAQSTKLAKDETLYTDPDTGAKTKLVALDQTHPTILTKWNPAWAEEKGVEFTVNKRSGVVWKLDPVRTRALSDGRTEEYRLGTNVKSTRAYMTTDQIESDKFEMVNAEKAEDIWRKAFDAAPKTYVSRVHLVTGTILPVWDRIPGISRIARAQEDTGKRHLGVLMPADYVPELEKNFGLEGKIDMTPAQAVDAVLEDAAVLNLSNGWKISRRYVSGEDRIEITGPDYTHQEELKRNGVLMERIAYQMRYFIPTGDNAEAVMAKVIRYKPIVEVLRKQGSLATEPPAELTESLPTYQARSHAELSALLPHMGLPEQTEKLMAAFLSEPVMALAPDIKLIVTDHLDGDFQGTTERGSGIQTIISIARSADPITGPHELSHGLLWPIMPEEMKVEFDRQRVATADVLIKEAQEAGKPETVTALTDIRDNPTVGGDDFLSRGYPLALRSMLYPISSAEEYFVHTMSNHYQKKVGSTVEGFWAKVKAIISQVIDAIKRALKLRPNQKEFLDNILEGRFEPANPISVAELERTNERYRQASIDDAGSAGKEEVPGAREPLLQPEDRRVVDKRRSAAVQLLSRLRPPSPQRGGPDQPIREVEPPGAGLNPSTDQQVAGNIREALEQILGVQIAFITSPGPGINGFVQKEIPGVLFVNAESKQPWLSVVGHELTHEIARSDPALYEELAAVLDPLQAGFIKYWTLMRSSYGRAKMELPDEALARENLNADLLGDSFIDPAFWNRLYEKEPSLFSRFARIVSDFFKRLVVGLRKYGAEQYFSDLRRAREALADAVLKFAKRQRDGTSTPGETKYSLSADEQKEEMDRMLDEAAEQHRIPTMVLGAEYYVLGREQLDPAAGHKLAKDILDSVGIPSTEQIVEQNGQEFPVWVMTPQGRDTTPDGEALLRRYKEELAKSEPGKARQDLGAIINSIRQNFEMPASKSAMAEMQPWIRVELWSAVQSDASARGLALRALMGVRDDAITSGRNIDAELGKIWSQALGGDAMRRVLDELEKARAEIERLRKAQGTAGGGARETQEEVDKLRKALEDALKKHAPTMRKRWGPGTRIGSKIIELIRGGEGKPWNVLREMARIEPGWKIPTDEQLQQVKRWADKLDEISKLTPEEAAGKTVEQQEEMLRLKSAGLADEQMRLRKEIETSLSRFMKPYTIRTRAGRENITSAIGDYISANFLAKPGFATRQFIDVVITQMTTYTPTSAIAHTLMLHEQAVAAGTRNRSDVGAVWKDLSVSIGAAYKARAKALRGALSAAGAVVTGANQGRNVAAIMQRVSIYDKMMQRADELDAKGEHAKAFLLKFATFHKIGYVIAQSLDQFQGVPLVHQEMHQQVVRAMRANGMTELEAEAKADFVVGDPKLEAVLATEMAKLFLEGAGKETTKRAVSHAAWRIAEAKAYERMRTIGMDADDYRNRNMFMLETNAWNEREEGGVGGTAASIMRDVSKLGRNISGAGIAGLPIGIGITAMTRFGNAIGIMLNRKLTWVGLGFKPGWFGVDERELGEDGIAKGGSPFYKYPEQRKQRKVEAGIGILGQIAMYLLVAAGFIIVRLAWPKDKEERQLWDRMGWKPGQVDIPTGDGKHIRLSLNVGWAAMFAPGLSAGAAIHDLGANEKKAQDKLNAEAEKLGIEPGKIRERSTGDYLAAAMSAAWRALTSGRTISGLLSAFSEQGTFHVEKSISSIASALSPYQPGIQEVLRMANGVVLDTRTASVWDYFMPLKSSGSAQVNFLGDPVGSGNAVQRVTEILTGGNNLVPINDKAREGAAAYQALFANGWRPPSIDPNRGYAIDGKFRPMTDKELQSYTVARGQYLKQELADLGPEATAKEAQSAYKRANKQALSDIGVDTPSRATAASGEARQGATQAGSAGVGGYGGSTRPRTFSPRSQALSGRRTLAPRRPRVGTGRRGPTLRVGRGLRLGAARVPRVRRGPGLLR